MVFKSCFKRKFLLTIGNPSHSNSFVVLVLVSCLKQSSQYMCEHVPLYRLGSFINGLKLTLSSRITILQVAHCFVVVNVCVGVMIDAGLMCCLFAVCFLMNWTSSYSSSLACSLLCCGVFGVCLGSLPHV